jgi:PAS domain-containing protein/DNA-binding CsgD family transcriptional regulator
MNVEPSTEAELRDAMHRNPLPLALIALDTMQFLDVNEAARRLIGASDDVEITLANVLLPEDEENARQALALIAHETIHAYETRRRLRRTDGTTIAGHVWVRSLAYLRPGTALAVFVSDDEARTADGDGEDLALIDAPGHRIQSLPPIAIASIGLDTTIKRISAESAEILGDSPAKLIGTPLVDALHPEDVAAFLLALGRALEDNAGVGMHVRVRRAPQGYTPIRILVTPTAGPTSTRFGVVFAPEDGAADRVADRVSELEDHLWRIALEVQAAGVADGMHRVPDEVHLSQLADLSARQWEVLTALVRGESDAEVASTLRLDEAAVHEQVATVLDKVGVGSRDELVTLFRAPDGHDV